jgi:hypothetical protein
LRKIASETRHTVLKKFVCAFWLPSGQVFILNAFAIKIMLLLWVLLLLEHLPQVLPLQPLFVRDGVIKQPTLFLLVIAANR